MHIEDYARTCISSPFRLALRAGVITGTQMVAAKMGLPVPAEPVMQALALDTCYQIVTTVVSELDQGPTPALAKWGLTKLKIVES